MRCPGQDMRYWKFDAIFDVECPNCGYSVEFFKDESSRKCPNCGERVVNPRMDFGCATYCRFASQCLVELPPELVNKRDDLLKIRIGIEARKYFEGDPKGYKMA